MGAKQKLNSANALGALVMATIIGVSFDSWAAFAIAATALVAASFYTGEIRR